MKKKLCIVLVVALLGLTACMPSQQQVVDVLSAVEQTAAAQVTFVAPTSNVNTIVQATFEALTAQAPTAASTATPAPAQATTTQGATDNIPTFTPAGGQSGIIAGTLSYPAEGIPAMAVIAYHVGGAPTDYYYVMTSASQSTYQIDNLPAGTYHVVAYSIGGGGFPAGLPGGYTQYVLCGMGPACSDHSYVEVPVSAGLLTANINPQDWYAPSGTFPPDPLP